MRSFSRFILTLDRRIIYLCVAAFVFIPLIFPLGLEIVTTREVEGAFDTIEALPAGSTIVISNDYGAASMPETHPVFIALLHQCFRKGIRPIIVTHVPDSPGITQEGLAEVLESRGPDGALLYPDLKNGTDYAWLGFKPNATAAILGVVQGFVGTWPTDYDGQPTAGMPIFARTRALKDAKAVFCIASVAMPEYWVNYGTQRTGVPLAVSCTSVSAVQYYPYLRAGQFVGLVNGMKGAAEYEKLVGMEEILGKTPDATLGMDPQSILHVFLVLAIVLANLAVFIERRAKAQEAGR